IDVDGDWMGACPPRLRIATLDPWGRCLRPRRFSVRPPAGARARGHSRPPPPPPASRRFGRLARSPSPPPPMPPRPPPPGGRAGPGGLCGPARPFLDRGLLG